MTSSNFVGCSTGISAGFVPRSTLSTISAARLHRSRKIRSIGHQCPGFDIRTSIEARRQPRAQGKRDDARPGRGNECREHDVQRVRLALERLEGGRNVVRTSDFQSGDGNAELACPSLNLVHFQHGGLMADVRQDRKPAQVGHDFAQQLEPLAGEVDLHDKPVTLPPGRDRLATRPAATGSVPRATMMGMVDVACFTTTAALSAVTITSTLRRTNSSAISPMRSGRPSAQRYSIVTVRAALDPAELAKSLNEGVDPRPPDRCRRRAEKADGRNFSLLLRARRKRPRCRAAE
jgi:hypothetical protein